jgi:multidrug efflux pump subunit AcrB
MLPLIGLDAIRQPFDMITMLGFLILLGTAVNNPILIVDRTMHHFREDGFSPLESVKSAVASRLRPVLMTTSTTLMGLSPLVFLPGAGTELYRGLGAIVLFGLAFTAFITLTFLPCLLVSLLAIFARFRGRPKVAESQEVGISGTTDADREDAVPPSFTNAS